MNTSKAQIEFLASTWGLSVRAAGRWLEYDTPAPLDLWILVPDWHGQLSDKTRCKLSPGFQRNILAAHQMARTPRPGTAQMGVWATAAEEALRRGKGMPVPETIRRWFDAEGWKNPPALDQTPMPAGGDLASWARFFAARPFDPSEFADAPTVPAKRRAS